MMGSTTGLETAPPGFTPSPSVQLSSALKWCGGNPGADCQARMETHTHMRVHTYGHTQQSGHKCCKDRVYFTVTPSFFNSLDPPPSVSMPFPCFIRVQGTRTNRGRKARAKWDPGDNFWEMTEETKSKSFIAHKYRHQCFKCSSQPWTCSRRKQPQAMWGRRGRSAPDPEGQCWKSVSH